MRGTEVISFHCCRMSLCMKGIDPYTKEAGPPQLVHTSGLRVKIIALKARQGVFLAGSMKSLFPHFTVILLSWTL